MIDWLRKFFRISVLFKTLTVLCLLGLILSYMAPFIHPETLWFIPFFGLAYPIIILSAFCLLIIWGIARSKWFFIVLFFILIGGKLHFRIYNPGIGKGDESSEKSLRILSYNVKDFDVYNVGFNKDYTNRDAIFNFLKQEQADIVCFQEFYFQDDKKKFPTKDTLFDLLQAENYHERMSFNRHFKNYFGVAIYSKYPMLTRGHIDFNEKIRNSNNFCIFADIVKESDTFRIYNTHFQSIQFQEDDYALFGQKEYTGKVKSGVRGVLRKLHIAYQKRAHQAREVVEHMQQSPYPVVICGDFNDTPLSYVYNIFYSKYKDAFRNSGSGLGVTYAGKVPAGRIDYIFHSSSLNSSDFIIQKEVFSDHKAISCKIWKK